MPMPGPNGERIYADGTPVRKPPESQPCPKCGGKLHIEGEPGHENKFCACGWSESQPEPCATCGGEKKIQGLFVGIGPGNRGIWEMKPCPDCQPDCRPQEPVSREHLEDLLNEVYNYLIPGANHIAKELIAKIEAAGILSDDGQ